MSIEQPSSNNRAPTPELGIVTESDKEILGEGIPSVVKKMLDRFDGKLPSAVVFVDTSARPLAYAFDPIFRKIAEKQGGEKPSIHFFNDFDVPGELEVRDGEGHLLSDGEKIAREKGENIKRVRAEEVRSFVQKRGGDPSKIVIIDDFAMNGRTRRELLRAFGESTPFFYIAAEHKDDENGLNDETVGTFVGHQGSYGAGRYGWWFDPDSFSNERLDRFEQIAEKSLDVEKTPDGKYAKRLKGLTTLREQEFVGDLIEAIGWDSELVTSYYGPDHFREVSRMSEQERTQLRGPINKQLMRRVERALEIARMGKEEIAGLTDEVDIKLAGYVKEAKELGDKPQRKERQEQLVAEHKAKVASLRSEMKSFGAELAKQFEVELQSSAPETFRVDEARLHESWNEHSAKEFERWKEADISTLKKPDVMTGEEHLLLASSWPFTFNYPITPAIALAQPAKIAEINQARQKYKEVRCFWAPVRPALPEPNEEKQVFPLISLSNINSQTGEAEMPQLVGLEIWEGGKKRIERDETMLKQYVFDPALVREKQIRWFDGFIKSYMESGDLERVASFQKSKEVFLKYYRKGE